MRLAAVGPVWRRAARRGRCLRRLVAARLALALLRDRRAGGLILEKDAFPILAREDAAHRDHRNRALPRDAAEARRELNEIVADRELVGCIGADVKDDFA